MRKSIWTILFCLAFGMTSINACDENDDTETGNQEQNNNEQGGNEQGGNEQGETEYKDSFSKQMAKLDPGVYTFTSDGDKDKTSLFAKSTDGWIFHIPKLNDYANAPLGNYFVPYDFKAIEPTNKYHQIYQWNEDADGSNIVDEGYIYHFRNDITEYPSRAELLEYELKGLGIAIETSSTYFNGKMKKEADSQGDNKATYKYIADHYFRGEEPVPDLDDMLQSYVFRYAPKWHSEVYPKSLEDMKLVFPVTANCEYMHQSVRLDWKWPETIGKVCKVEVTATGINADDCRAYYEKVTSEAEPTRVEKSEASDGIYEFDAYKEHFNIDGKEYEIHYKVLANEKTNAIIASYEIVYIQSV